MTQRLQFTLLGNPEIRLNGDRLSFKYQKSIALLVYLVVTRRSHSRQKLAGLLWGETTEANARAGLRKSLSDLRSQVEAHLTIERHQVSCDFSAPFDLDVEDFQIQMDQFRESSAADLDLEQAARLIQAMDAYQGDFLAGFHIRRAAAFEEWVTVQRERFRLDAIQGLHLLADYFLTQGEYPQAVHHLERLLALEPCQEEAHRQMMSLLALQGKQGAALQQYQVCRRLLRTTLDIEPQVETTALYERIRQQSNMGDQRNPRRGQLPVPLTPLIGRQAEIESIEEQLEAPICRLLTILGPGGSGKTHLVLTVGDRYAQRDVSIFEHGITFIPLNSLRNLSALPAALMHGLGFHFDKEASPTQQLLDQLSEQKRLIILDNFEHLLAPPQSPQIPGEKDNISSQTLIMKSKVSPPVLGGTEGGAFLTRLLQTAPDVKIIVTSRIRLNLQCEQIFPLQGIAYPSDQDELPATSTYPALDLFIQRARLINPDFNPDSHQQEQAIAQICRQVAGLPLGILLAAGWSGTLSPSEIANQLSDSGDSECFDLLESERSDLPARQRSLRRVFDYSWELLSTKKRVALAVLSIFPGSFTTHAAQQIGDIELEHVRTLIDHCLLQRASSSRYQMHEITRQFAGQKISDPDNIRTQYCHYYTTQLAQWALEIRGAEQLQAIKELDLEIDNILLAWDWLLEEADFDALNLALDSICLYYNWRSRFPDGYQLCSNLRQHLDAFEEQEKNTRSRYKQLYAKALTWQSVFAPLDQNEPLLRQALDYLSEDDEEGSQAVKAFCLARLGRVVSHTGNASAGRAFFEKSLAIYHRGQDQAGLANALTDYGILLWDSAVYDEAQEILQNSLEIHQTLGNLAGSANAMVWLGTVMLFQGQAEGEVWVRESLSLFKNMGNQVSMTESFHTAILAMSLMGRYEEAYTLLKEKNELDKDGGIHHHATHTLLADTLSCLGKYEEARHHAQVGLKLAKRSGDTIILGHAMVMNGWIAITDEDYESALGYFQECVQLSQKHNLKEILCWGSSYLGYAHWQLGQPEQAVKNFIQALTVGVELESFIGIIYALSGGIPIIAHLGSPALALTCYAHITQYPLLANAVFFHELVGPHIAAFKAELTPKQIARAEARGQKMDLEALVSEILGILEKI